MRTLPNAVITSCAMLLCITPLVAASSVGSLTGSSQPNGVSAANLGVEPHPRHAAAARVSAPTPAASTVAASTTTASPHAGPVTTVSATVLPSPHTTAVPAVTASTPHTPSEGIVIDAVVNVGPPGTDADRQHETWGQGNYADVDFSDFGQLTHHCEENYLNYHQNFRPATTHNTEPAKAQLDYVNAFRLAHGVPQLKWDSEVAEGSGQWAQLLASVSQLQHDMYWINNTNAAYTGENLATHLTTDTATIVRGWIGSPQHCANLLLNTFTHAGAATHRDEHGHVWAVLRFITPFSTS